MTTMASIAMSAGPCHALKSLDGNGRVLYAGTFSKVLMPSLRLAYLVVPGRSSNASSRSFTRLAQARPTSFRRWWHPS